MIYLTYMISILNSIFIVVLYAMRWTKLDLVCVLKKLINLSLLEIFIVHLYQLNGLCEFSSFFGSVRFASSPPFPLSGVTFPPVDVATPQRRVVLPSHGAKTSSLPPLHLSATLHLVASPLELKSKHWIRITAVGHPPRIAGLLPFTTIKKSS
jgi:hypothetical protein